MSSWIKMNTSLRDNPKVDSMACELDTTEAEILGALFILWSVADSQTEDGHLSGMSIKMIDRKTGVNGFGNALALSGWLVEDSSGVTLPNFGEHNGATAKKRSSTAKRQADFKSKSKGAKNHTTVKDAGKSNAPALPVDNAPALPREDKSRVDKIRKEELPHGVLFAKAWSEWGVFRKEIKKKLTPSTESKQLKKLGSMTESQAIASIDQSIEKGWAGLFDTDSGLPTSKSKPTTFTELTATAKSEQFSRNMQNPLY